MHKASTDQTIERNYIRKWRLMIKEYEAIKKKRHPRFKFVGDFYKHHGVSRQIFNKYYHRYQSSQDGMSLLPRKRGPKWRSRTPIYFIEKHVLRLREQGLSRYEISYQLQAKLKKYAPSPSGVYTILRRYEMNRLTKPMKMNKRKIIKEKPGEMGHVDCHYLPKDLLLNGGKRYYLVAVVDDCTRLAWVEVVEDIKSITVMFAVLRCMNMLRAEYNIQFQEILTDNGSEFKSPSRDNKAYHPFERMLSEFEIKHRFTRPCRPQTNGKVERFWRTLNEDLIEGADFDNIDEFCSELLHYLVYYNDHRPHQGIGGATPKQVSLNLSAN